MRTGSPLSGLTLPYPVYAPCKSSQRKPFCRQDRQLHIQARRYMIIRLLLSDIQDMSPVLPVGKHGVLGSMGGSSTWGC
jgi:hypothetical protein